jgi:O-antigen ligase
MIGHPLARERLSMIADNLAAAVVIMLPWSTSAATILGWIWLLALVPALDCQLLLRTLTKPAVALPLGLLGLSVLGMAWANVSWLESYYGFDSFPKLLAIPLLTTQFTRPSQGSRVLAGFIISGSVLLAASWFLALGLIPQLPNKTLGVLVKDRISQGTIFTLCMMFLLELAIDAWKGSRTKYAILAFTLSGAFFLNVVLVTLSRTSLVSVPILLALFGARHLRSRHLAAFVAALALVGMMAWITSPALRQRVTQIPDEIVSFNPLMNDTSAGARIQFWKISLKIMGEAPIAGHGTGSINAEFARVAGAKTNATNPHNQIFAVGIQLGLLGVGMLIAMWCAHLWLFRTPGIAEWVGLMVVAENVIASAFNSALFDFTQGWIYVFAVGIAGGIVLHSTRSLSEREQSQHH